MAAYESIYWCYRCHSFVTPGARRIITCPDCGPGCVEEIEHSSLSPTSPRGLPLLHRNNESNSPLSRFSPRRLLRCASFLSGNNNLTRGLVSPNSGPIHPSPRYGDRTSVYNPVIVLRSSLVDSTGSYNARRGDEESVVNISDYQLYYDDGLGNGLHPFPASMSDMLMDSGIKQLLEDFLRIHRNSNRSSKASFESMPIVKISASHIAIESHCAVCTESFELDTEALELPCKHIFHSDCIVPWLSVRNSCPVCRLELPVNMNGSEGSSRIFGSEEDNLGLAIWRLPGDGFAIGNFHGNRRMPSVYTELDGPDSFYNGGGGGGGGNWRRISMTSSGGRSSRESRGLSRVFHGLVSFFKRGRNSETRSNSEFGFICSTSIFGERRNQGRTFRV